MSFPPPTERQARLLWLALSGLAAAVLVGLAAGLIWSLGRIVQLLGPVLWPLAVAGVISYLLDPVVDFFERKGASRPRAILAVFALALLIAAGLAGSIVPQLVQETRQLALRIPAYADRLETRLQHWVDHPPPFVQRLLEREAGTGREPGGAASTNAPPTTPPLSSADTPNNTARPAAPGQGGGAFSQQDLQTAASWFAKALGQIGPWLLSQVGRLASWFGVLVGLALIPVYTFYFLLEKQGISSRWTDYLPVSDSSFKQELVFVLRSINSYLIAFFRGQVLVAICDGTLYGIGFLAIGLPYAVLIGVLAIGLTMIPFLGAILTCSTAVVIAIVQFGDWLHPLLVLAVFGVVQALEALVVSPRIMGGRVGLHPVTIIIAVMIGTTLLGGLLGGVLAIPLTAALRVAMFRYVWKKPSATSLSRNS
jgi:predicted PurR-regulated permease PerM